MYAVIKTGGKQYRVTPGESLKVETIVANVGDTVSDLQAAHNAGVGISVGVLSGAHTREQLARGGHADHLVVASYGLAPGNGAGEAGGGEFVQHFGGMVGVRQ